MLVWGEGLGMRLLYHHLAQLGGNLFLQLSTPFLPFVILTELQKEHDCLGGNLSVWVSQLVDQLGEEQLLLLWALVEEVKHVSQHLLPD